MNLSSAEKMRRLERNSLDLLMMLSLPAFAMGMVLLLWPNVTWKAEALHTAIVLFGSLAAVMLSVITIVRYHSRAGIEYLSSGLLAVGITGGFQSISLPGSSTYIWFHVYSGLFGGVCFFLYIFNQWRLGAVSRPWNKRNDLVVAVTVVSVLFFGLGSFAINSRLPAMVVDDSPTQLAWIMNAFPLAVYLVVAVYLFSRYRTTGNGELFLFTAILIFLFQANEVFYFARLWSIVWWLWLTLRLAIYLSILAFVIKEYIHTSRNLAEEIKQRESILKELHQSENDWRDSFNSLEDALLIIDADYSVLNLNDAALNLAARRVNENANRKCYALMLGRDEPCNPCLFATTLKTRRTACMQRFDERTGRHYSVKITPVFGDDGRIQKFVYLLSDITERIASEKKEELLQRELSQRSRLASIGEVVAGVTHEINNPLTSIITFAQLMKRSDIPENMREAVEVINDSTNRVAEIVDKLHTFSRRQRPEKEYTDVNGIISSVLQMRSFELRKRDIEVVSHLDEMVTKTMVNVGQLQQVLLNLIVNAEQAMIQAKKHGILIVNSSEANGYIKVVVSDNGLGIKEENMEKLFTPFFTTKDANGGPGLGLGLSISYGIVKEHGGRIYARSCPGSGATFAVELPVVADPESQTEHEKQDIQGVVSMGKSRVLVLDDEVHIRRALDRVLTGEGHEVASIANAQHALEMIRERDFDLIVIDIKMPGMDGISFFDQLVNLKPSYRNKVICMTGDMVSSRNKDFIKNENIPYLIKPFGIDELLERVKSVMGGCTNA